MIPAPGMFPTSGCGCTWSGREGCDVGDQLRSSQECGGAQRFFQKPQARWSFFHNFFPTKSEVYSSFCPHRNAWEGLCASHWTYRSSWNEGYLGSTPGFQLTVCSSRDFKKPEVGLTRSARLGGGNSNIIGIFIPNIGVSWSNLTWAYFFRWVGEIPPTTSSRWCSFQYFSCYLGGHKDRSCKVSSFKNQTEIDLENLN